MRPTMRHFVSFQSAQRLPEGALAPDGILLVTNDYATLWRIHPRASRTQRPRSPSASHRPHSRTAGHGPWRYPRPSPTPWLHRFARPFRVRHEQPLPLFPGSTCCLTNRTASMVRHRRTPAGHPYSAHHTLSRIHHYSRGGAASPGPAASGWVRAVRTPNSCTSVRCFSLSSLKLRER